MHSSCSYPRYGPERDTRREREERCPTWVALAWPADDRRGCGLHGAARGAGATALARRERAEHHGGKPGGTEPGGRQPGGTNLAGTNLGGANLGGNNLGGANLAGSTSAAPTWAATTSAGNNLGGTNLGGSNLGGANLGGDQPGRLQPRRLATWPARTWPAPTSAATTSAAPTWAAPTWRAPTPAATSTTSRSRSTGCSTAARTSGRRRTAQCIVFGIGSTAFAKLLGPAERQRQDLGGPRQAALGLRHASGGGRHAAAPGKRWSGATRTYCVVRPGRPADRDLARGGRLHQGGLPLERAPHPDHGDQRHRGQRRPRPHACSTGIVTYTGMMNAAAQVPRPATSTETAFMAGELAFVSATTNNQSVLVDFSSWVQDTARTRLVLGNVTAGQPAQLRRGDLHRPRQRATAP